MVNDVLDKGAQSLLQWVRSVVECTNISLQPLGGDAGFRRYFRINGSIDLLSESNSQVLAVLAPVETENSRLFVAIAEYWRSLGIKTPKIFAVDYEQGFLLVEDFGPELLADRVCPENADGLYQQAVDVLIRLQSAPVVPLPVGGEESTVAVSDYNRQKLLDELVLFDQWMLPQLLGIKVLPEERRLLDQLYGQLVDRALRQPQIWVHRDYHSRNLMCVQEAPLLKQGGPEELNDLGVIDFQDAVKGPITYDPVSLFKDCYRRWPVSQVKRWALDFRRRAIEAGLMEECSDEEFLKDFDWMGLQRHIKVLGIFSRLSLRDGKHGYLADLSLVIRYTLEAADDYPETREFADWFKRRVLPVCAEQNWYRDYRTAGDLQI